MTEGREAGEMLVREWRLLDELCSTLTEDQWKADTDCPGWTVKDQISHISGSESWLLGRPSPDHTVEGADYVKNPLGERNEIEVDYRRPWPPAKVLDEFREVTAERGRQIESMSDEDFEAETWTPFGQGSVASFLGMRVVDNWVHEQDIRRAAGTPGHLQGDIPQHVFDLLLLRVPKVVGKNAGAPEGSVSIFEISGARGGTFAVGVENGRARMLDEVPRAADVRLVMDLQTFVCLINGRWPPARTLKAGLVEVEGDGELGSKIVGGMNVMF